MTSYRNIPLTGSQLQIPTYPGEKYYVVELICTSSLALRKLACSLNNTIHDALFPMALCLGCDLPGV